MYKSRVGYNQISCVEKSGWEDERVQVYKKAEIAITFNLDTCPRFIKTIIIIIPDKFITFVALEVI